MSFHRITITVFGVKHAWLLPVLHAPILHSLHILRSQRSQATYCMRNLLWHGQYGDIAIMDGFIYVINACIVGIAIDVYGFVLLCFYRRYKWFPTVYITHWSLGDVAIILKIQILLIAKSSSFNNHCEIPLMWIPQNLTNEKSTWVQVMAWCCQTTGHYLSQYWPRFMSLYDLTRPQWFTRNRCVSKNCKNRFHFTFVNSLGPTDATWRQRTESTLAQIMACYLTVPSHYLNQCWLISSEV